jgi:hypothetical protein
MHRDKQQRSGNESAALDIWFFGFQFGFFGNFGNFGNFTGMTATYK